LSEIKVDPDPEFFNNTRLAMNILNSRKHSDTSPQNMTILQSLYSKSPIEMKTSFEDWHFKIESLQTESSNINTLLLADIWSDVQDQNEIPDELSLENVKHQHLEALNVLIMKFIKSGYEELFQIQADLMKHLDASKHKKQDPETVLSDCFSILKSLADNHEKIFMEMGDLQNIAKNTVETVGLIKSLYDAFNISMENQLALDGFISDFDFCANFFEFFKDVQHAPMSLIQLFKITDKSDINHAARFLDQKDSSKFERKFCSFVDEADFRDKFYAHVVTKCEEELTFMHSAYARVLMSMLPDIYKNIPKPSQQTSTTHLDLQNSNSTSTTSNSTQTGGFITFGIMNQSNHSMQNVLVMENKKPIHFLSSVGVNRFTQTESSCDEKSTSTDNQITISQADKFVKAEKIRHARFRPGDVVYVTKSDTAVEVLTDSRITDKKYYVGNLKPDEVKVPSLARIENIKLCRAKENNKYNLSIKSLFHLCEVSLL